MLIVFESFLPRTDNNFSTNVIMAYGGGNWVEFILNAGAGINEAAKKVFFADNAIATYRTFYDQLSVTNASVGDYRDGATTDYDEMVADQQAGRKIKMPTHVEYSYYNLVTESGFDVQKVWQDYVEPSAGLTTEGIKGGQGHFIIELAPQQTIGQLNKFLDRLGVKAALKA
jgi:haloacetate dehalogenase